MTTPLHLAKGRPSVIYDPTPTGKLPCGLFKRVQIVTNPLGGNLIAWEMFSGLTYQGPWHFYVDFGRPGADFGNMSDTEQEWETLNQSPVVDSCVYFDAKERHWDQLIDFFYRIRLVLPAEKDAEGKSLVILSQPQQANGVLSKRDWLMARDISRKEYLLQRKRTNITARGWLLKRKRWGNKCPDCKEFDTGEVLNGRCTRCWGTSFIGGFYPAVEYNTIMSNAPWVREFVRDPQISMRNGVVRYGRSVAYPYVDTNDIFVAKDKGDRYYVNRIQTGAEIGNVPLVVILELRLAPVTDIIYTIPLTGSPASSSSGSSSSETQPEWKEGLDPNAPNWGNGHV
jgi:hypothetical protein